jgi:hypothetical protein
VQQAVASASPDSAWDIDALSFGIPRIGSHKGERASKVQTSENGRAGGFSFIRPLAAGAL